jgi:hypothetical protein
VAELEPALALALALVLVRVRVLAVQQAPVPGRAQEQVLVRVWTQGLAQALELAPDLAPEQVPGRVPVMALAWVAALEPAVAVLAEAERVVVEQAWGLVPE